jgi:hypothetical protein
MRFLCVWAQRELCFIIIFITSQLVPCKSELVSCKSTFEWISIIYIRKKKVQFYDTVSYILHKYRQKTTIITEVSSLAVEG